MKKLSYSVAAFGLTALFFMAISTGCGKKGGAKAGCSEKCKLLMSTPWKLDVNATIKTTTDSIKDTTGVTADIKLEGDVGDFANFIAETLVFGEDKKDKTKLSYSRTIGEGILSSQVLGYWNFNADETAIVMREWDSAKGAEKPPVNYKIVELTADKLVLQKEGDTMPTTYKKK